MKSVLRHVATIALTLIAAWSTGILEKLPSVGQTWLALGNTTRFEPQRAEDGFRIVLSWLENDRSGDDTRNVARAFTNVEGVTLVRSARIVAASGASDEWTDSMHNSAHRVLDDWNADLAVVGLVKRPGEILSLWFVPRSSTGTLGRGDTPYRLEDVTLGADFHDDLRAQLTAAALAAVAPLADNEALGRVLEEGLRDAADKLSKLLDGRTIRKSERRAALYLVLGDALATIGERERGNERLEQAVAAYLAALALYDRERWPLRRAQAQHNLGNVLFFLGERESGTERLERAMDAYRATLDEFTPERTPQLWAMAQVNLCRAFGILGHRQRDSVRVERAVRACRDALDGLNPDQRPLVWAMAQNNLGNALAILGKWERDSERLRLSLDAYDAALKETARERVPIGWARTQHNIGIVRFRLGTLERSPVRIEEAIDAFHDALGVLTPERSPRAFATTQHHLGDALSLLGRWAKDTELLDDAAAAYRAALEEIDTDATNPVRNLVLKKLQRVLGRLHVQDAGPAPVSTETQN